MTPRNRHVLRPTSRGVRGHPGVRSVTLASDSAMLGAGWSGTRARRRARLKEQLLSLDRPRLLARCTSAAARARHRGARSPRRALRRGGEPGVLRRTSLAPTIRSEAREPARACPGVRTSRSPVVATRVRTAEGSAAADDLLSLSACGRARRPGDLSAADSRQPARCINTVRRIVERGPQAVPLVRVKTQEGAHRRHDQSGGNVCPPVHGVRAACARDCVRRALGRCHAASRAAHERNRHPHGARRSARPSCGWSCAKC